MRSVSRARIAAASSALRRATIRRSVTAHARITAVSARSAPSSDKRRFGVQNGARFTTSIASGAGGSSSTFSTRAKSPASMFSMDV